MADLRVAQVDRDAGRIELELDAVRSAEQGAVGRARDLVEARERATRDDRDAGVVGGREALDRGARAIGRARVLRPVDEGRERAVEVERDEQALGAREASRSPPRSGSETPGAMMPGAR